MYGKIFDSMYEGTLYGHWEAIVTLQQFIVLCDADGMLDMTPQAIAARTSIPLDIITKGIKVLSEPDPYTRTRGEEGRRLILIDAHRPWGWVIVNHAKYKAMRDMEQKREADRLRIAEKRSKNKDVAIVSQGVAKVAHTDTHTDADTKTPLPPSGAFLRFWGAWPAGSRKQGRGSCWDVWRKRDLDLQADEILAHVEALKQSQDWRKEGGEYIPAPRVYLSQRRWEGAEAPRKPELKVAMP